MHFSSFVLSGIPHFHFLHLNSQSRDGLNYNQYQWCHMKQFWEQNFLDTGLESTDHHKIICQGLFLATAFGEEQNNKKLLNRFTRHSAHS